MWNKIEKHIFVIIVSVLVIGLAIKVIPVYAKHTYLERDYQNVWCNSMKGQQEVIMPDGSRCDCIYDEYAIEFDFASKWAESCGQALLYAAHTEKKPGIVLIMEDVENDLKYLKRLELLIKTWNLPIRIWTITPEDIKLNYKGN